MEKENFFSIKKNLLVQYETSLKCYIIFAPILKKEFHKAAPKKSR